MWKTTDRYVQQVCKVFAVIITVGKIMILLKSQKIGFFLFKSGF